MLLATRNDWERLRGLLTSQMVFDSLDCRTVGSLIAVRLDGSFINFVVSSTAVCDAGDDEPVFQIGETGEIVLCSYELGSGAVLMDDDGCITLTAPEFGRATIYPAGQWQYALSVLPRAFAA